jgi:ABC-type multidrug transport system ATPase subunit
MNSSSYLTKIYHHEDRNLNQVSTSESVGRDANFKRVYLEWDKLTYIPCNKIYGNVRVLNSITGFANFGEMLAIMGSSGAGKTTLLNALCQRLIRRRKDKYEGNILANGVNITTINYRDFLGYVTQQDLMMPTMTVRETLEFAGILKISGNREYVNNKIQEMIKHLHLEGIPDSVIGSQIHKGISGGERKRVAIGLELLSEPSLLFLDEPTSGLDAYTADLIVGLMEKEARKGRNVIATIHQPSRRMFEMFDRLILMCEGKFVYQGLREEAKQYLYSIGYTITDYINPADFFIDLLHIRNRFHKTPEEEQRLELLLSSYKENEPHFYSLQRNFNLRKGSP